VVVSLHVYRTVQAWDMDFITASQGLSSCQIDLADALDTAMRKRKRKLKNGAHNLSHFIIRCYFCLSILLYLCTGNTARFTHQVFFKPLPSAPNNSAGQANSSRRSPRAEGTYFGQFKASTVACCASAMSCCGLWKSRSTSDAPASGVRNAEGTALDNTVDLEAGGGGASELTPLLKQSSAASYTSGPIAIPESGTTTLETIEEDDGDDQGDLADSPTPAAAAGPGAAKAASKRRRRKRRPTMYEGVLQAMGLGATTIEHAEEVQLSDASGNPAGKVRKYCIRAYCYNSLVLRVAIPTGADNHRDHAQERGGHIACWYGSERAEHEPGAAGPRGPHRLHEDVEPLLHAAVSPPCLGFIHRFRRVANLLAFSAICNTEFARGRRYLQSSLASSPVWSAWCCTTSSASPS
jgi:hypothetical protein